MQHQYPLREQIYRRARGLPIRVTLRDSIAMTAGTWQPAPNTASSPYDGMDDLIIVQEPRPQGRRWLTPGSDDCIRRELPEADWPDRTLMDGVATSAAELAVKNAVTGLPQELRAVSEYL